MKFNGFVCSGVLVASGVFCLVLGLVISIMIPKKLKDGVTIAANSDAEERFKVPSVPIYANYYLFNITNEDKVYNTNVRAKVVDGDNNTRAVVSVDEIGPFVYRLHTSRNISSNENGKVQYKKFAHYEYIANRSVDFVDNIMFLSMDVFAALHKAAVGGLAMSKKLMTFIQTSPDLVLTSPITNRSAKALLEGWNSSFLEAINDTSDENIQTTLSLIDNNTVSEDFVIDTGENELPDIGRVLKYADASTFDNWNTSVFANMINGTDLVFHPHLLTSDKLEFFNPNLCRSVHMVFQKSMYIGGIQVYRYVFPKEMFESPYVNLRNADFCPNSGCLNHSGLLSVENCKDGIKTALSTPHHLMSDDILQGIPGMKPDVSKHESYMDIEPTTGTLLRMAQRFQANMYMSDVGINISLISPSSGRKKGGRRLTRLKYPVFGLYSRFSDQWVPLYWFDISLEADEPALNKLSSQLNKLVTYSCLKNAFFAIGVLLIILGVAMLVYSFLAKRKHVASKDITIPEENASKADVGPADDVATKSSVVDSSGWHSVAESVA